MSRLLFLVVVLAVSVGASPANACSRLASYWPTSGPVPVDGWLWVFSETAETDFVLSNDDGPIPLRVQEVVPAGGGRMLALTPEASVAPGSTYRLHLVSESEPVAEITVTFTAPNPDDAAPTVSLTRTGFVLFDVADLCIAGLGDSTLRVCGAVSDAALLESRLLDADGTVLLQRVIQGGVFFDYLADDVRGLRLEVRGVGPRGERGEWVTEELQAVEGYAWSGIPSGALFCGEQLTLDGEVLATSDRATPIGAQAGGCSVTGAPASAAPLLLLLAALGLRRRR